MVFLNTALKTSLSRGKKLSPLIHGGDD